MGCDGRSAQAAPRSRVGPSPESFLHEDRHLAKREILVRVVRDVNAFEPEADREVEVDRRPVRRLRLANKDPEPGRCRAAGQLPDEPPPDSAAAMRRGHAEFPHPNAPVPGSWLREDQPDQLPLVVGAEGPPESHDLPIAGDFLRRMAEALHVGSRRDVPRQGEREAAVPFRDADLVPMPRAVPADEAEEVGATEDLEPPDLDAAHLTPPRHTR